MRKFIESPLVIEISSLKKLGKWPILNRSFTLVQTTVGLEVSISNIEIVCENIKYVQGYEVSYDQTDGEDHKELKCPLPFSLHGYSWTRTQWNREKNLRMRSYDFKALYHNFNSTSHFFFSSSVSPILGYKWYEKGWAKEIIPWHMILGSSAVDVSYVKFSSISNS